MPEDLPVRKCINVMVGITRSKVIYLFMSMYVYIYIYNYIYTQVMYTSAQHDNIEKTFFARNITMGFEYSKI